METSSRFKALGQTFSLVYKIVFTLIAGALLMALVMAGFHFRAVHTGLQQAERLLAQGQLPEADALAFRLEPWARCFPGRFRICAFLRVRCLVRSNQPEAAARLAEALRRHVDIPVPRGSAGEFARDPLLWLQKTSLFMVTGLLDALYPAVQLNEWAGYETLLDELVSRRDTEGLNALADDLISRFPRSPIAILANSARGELQPAAPVPTMPHASPSTQPPTAPANPAALPPSSIPDPDPAAAAPDVMPPPRPASWGIVTNASAMALNPQTGKPVRPLKVGDVLVIEGACTLQDVPAFTGTLILNNRNVPDLAFSGKDLELRNGAFDAVPPVEVALRSRLAEIQAEENALQPKLARELASLSPEENAYRQSKAKMDAFQREVDALNVKLQKATGPDRMAVLDKLRLLKYQEQALIRDLAARKETADLTNRKAGRITVEPQLIALRQEKMAVLKKLAESTP